MTDTRKTKLFLSYGRRDAAELANRLRCDLEKLGYPVWQDTREIRAGREWEEQIADGLRSTQVVIALLSPHAVRRASDPNSQDNVDSVCLDELTFARFAAPPTPIVPVMAIPCEPPFPVFRLDYVSMTQWMHSEDEYQRGFKRLAAGIEAAATGKPLPMRRWHHCLPVLDFAAQLHEKRRDFVGRQWLFDELDAWRVSSSRERALLVVGDPGIGKSAFVAEMIHRNPDGQVLAYHICRADDPESLRPSTFVMSLAGMIAGRLPAFADLLESPQFQEIFDPKTVSSRPAHVFDQGLIAALHQLPAPTDGIRFVLIDALDEALSLGEGHLNIVSLLSPRLDRLPAWLRIVATTRREPDVLNKLSTLRAAAIDAHGQDNLDDIDRFIEARLQTPDLAERLAASRVPLLTVQHKLRDKADGNFLYLSQALQDIERDNYSFSRLDELPQGLNQWYEASFARKFPNPRVDFVDARAFLEVVLASREPLNAEQITIFASLDYESKFRKVNRQLASFLRVSNGRYSLYHKSIVDWFTSDASLFGGDLGVSIEEGHQRIANRGLTEFQNLIEGISDFHIRNLVYHLTKIKAVDRLSEVLTDLRFLEEKAKRGFVFELTIDFQSALDTISDVDFSFRRLSVLGTALRADAQFIAQHIQSHPHVLFQCLWNSCWWYDCPELRVHVSNCDFLLGESQKSGTLCVLLESWLADKETVNPDFVWIRSLRPPENRVGRVAEFISGHQNCVTGLALSPDDSTLVSCARDGGIRVWDTRSFKLKAELSIFSSEENPEEFCIPSVKFSHDSKYLIASSYWRMRIGIGSVGLASGRLPGKPSRLKVWKFPSLEELWVFQSSWQQLASAMSSKMRTFVILDQYSYLYLYSLDPDTKNKSPICIRKVAWGYHPWQLQFTPCGKVLTVFVSCYSVYTYRVPGLVLEHSIEIEADRMIGCFVGSIALLVSDTIRLTSVVNGDVIFEWIVTSDKILTAIVSDDANVFWALSKSEGDDICVHVHRRHDGFLSRIPLGSVCEESDEAPKISVNREGCKATLKIGNRLFIFDIALPNSPREAIQPSFQYSALHSLDDVLISPSGDTFATIESSGAQSKWVRQYRMTERELIIESPAESSRILGFTDDAELLLVTSFSQFSDESKEFSQFRIWSLLTNEVLIEFPEDEFRIQEPSFVSDKYVFSLCSDSIVRFWNIESGQLTDAIPLQEPKFGEVQMLLNSFRHNNTNLRSIACSESSFEAYSTGKLSIDLSAPAAGNEPREWNSEFLLICHRITGDYQGLVFEKVVVAVSDSESRQSFVDLSESPLPCVMFTPDMSKLTVALGNCVYIWNVESRQFDHRFVDQAHEVAAIAINRMGDRVYTAGFDQKIRIRELGLSNDSPNYLHTASTFLQRLRDQLVGSEHSDIGPDAARGDFQASCRLHSGTMRCGGYSDNTRFENKKGVAVAVLNQSFPIIRSHLSRDIVFCRSVKDGFEHAFQVEGKIE